MLFAGNLGRLGLIAMPVGFHAITCTVTYESDVLVTALGAPSTEGDDFYLMFQHKPAYDEQDVKFGMDRPYIEFCGQDWSWYGHILSVRLRRDRMQVQMDEDASKHMDNDGHLEVTFALDEAQFNALRSAIGTTFNGETYFVDET